MFERGVGNDEGIELSSFGFAVYEVLDKEVLRMMMGNGDLVMCFWKRGFFV